MQVRGAVDDPNDCLRGELEDEDMRRDSMSQS